jgi:hypothetical protein
MSITEWAGGEHMWSDSSVTLPMGRVIRVTGVCRSQERHHRCADAVPFGGENTVADDQLDKSMQLKGIALPPGEREANRSP